MEDVLGIWHISWRRCPNTHAQGNQSYQNTGRKRFTELRMWKEGTNQLSKLKMEDSKDNKMVCDTEYERPGDDWEIKVF